MLSSISPEYFCTDDQGIGENPHEQIFPKSQGMELQHNSH